MNIKITQCDGVYVKLSNSQLNELKSATNSKTFIKYIGNSNDEANFANLSANIRVSKTQLSEAMLPGGFLGRLLGPLLKTGLPLIKNVLKPLVNSV